MQFRQGNVRCKEQAISSEGNTLPSDKKRRPGVSNEEVNKLLIKSEKFLKTLQEMNKPPEEWTRKVNTEAMQSMQLQAYLS